MKEWTNWGFCQVLATRHRQDASGGDGRCESPASLLYRRFLVTLLRRFDHVAQRRVLAYTPPERRAEFALVASDAWTLDAQVSGDLGKRMQHYFAEAFRRGADRVVLIGSDSPTLPLEYVTGAFQLLDTFPVVLGPSADGGYYLVGAAGEVPPIFAGRRLEHLARLDPDAVVAAGRRKPLRGAAGVV